MCENDYFLSAEFQRHRESICNLLDDIPMAEAPKGWVFKGCFAVSGFEYFGFSENSNILFVASAQGRRLIDMTKNKKVARDYSVDFEINETFLTCYGFDVLDGKKIMLAGKYGGSILPVSNIHHESLRRVSPLYPCEDIVFQPPFEDCFSKNHNKNCVRIYRGFLYCYGFSFCGNYFVIAGDCGINCWEKER